MFSAFPPFKVLKALYKNHSHSHLHTSMCRHWGQVCCSALPDDTTTQHAHVGAGIRTANLPVVKQPALPLSPLKRTFFLYVSVIVSVYTN